MFAYSFFRGNTTHHRHSVGEFIFLVERVTVWGKIIDLYLLRVNLSWLFALRSRPLRHMSIQSHMDLPSCRKGLTRSWREVATFSGGINML
jgi:hypothetical protein